MSIAHDLFKHKNNNVDNFVKQFCKINSSIDYKIIKL